MARGNYKQGWYQPENPDKWLLPESSITNGRGIRFMSSWESRVFRFLDRNSGIIKIASEPFPIPYKHPKDGKTHRYYPDILVKNKDGTKFLVEIKPLNQVEPPKKPKRWTEKAKYNYNEAILTYCINQAKWKAAREFCEKHNLKFIIITEKELQI